jgi:hypothetical protein
MTPMALFSKCHRISEKLVSFDSQMPIRAKIYVLKPPTLFGTRININALF